MVKINNFKKKGGVIVWIDGLGVQATYNGNPIKLFIEKATNEIFRVVDNNWHDPPIGFTRAKGLL